MLKLFLGLTQDLLFQKELKQANPYYVNLIIGKPEYLHILHYQENQYLGKFFDGYPSLDQIVDLEKHLLSLLRILTPCYPFKDNPLKLIPFPVKNITIDKLTSL
jgi:hypothetical protein